MTSPVTVPTRAPGWAPLRWLRAAWGRLTWHHVALAAVLSVVWAAIGPVGGAWLFPLTRKSDLLLSFLSCRWMLREFVVIFLALVADAAFDEGVSPWLAYGGAVVAAVIVSPELDRLAGLYLLGFNGSRAFGRFWQLQVLSQGTLGMAMYAYWRVGQKSLERAQEIETERLRLRQRLEASTLRALQARVDPQLLSDALARVGGLHETDPAVADRLLGDLIALLRAMLPHDEGALSTVAQEMALVEAWLHVRRQVEDRLPEVRLRTPASLGAEPMPPMLALPLLRAVLAAGDAGSRWTLAARVEADRLCLELALDGPPPDRLPELGPLRERLSSLHGEAARLRPADEARAWTMELPRTAKEPA